MVKGKGAASVAVGTFCVVAALASVAAAAPDPLGLTTAEQRVVPGGAAGFDQLGVGPGEGYTVREEGLGSALPGRAERRVSLAYFGQLSDFQLADEESPARVEFVDPTGPPVEAAFRPWEALNPFIDEAMIRQVNAFAGASPIVAGDGSRSEMGFAIDTGDSADNQQLNETEWVRTLLEGGPLDPNSGVDPASSSHPSCLLVLGGAAEAARYTGVQDYEDYAEGPDPYFYDPDDPRGAAAGWPEYPGLMDRAQQAFAATGLAVPSYVTFGNHDALAQGNQAANASFEEVATGCVKPMVGVPGELEGLSDLSPATLQSNPAATAFVPPDPERRYVSKAEYKAIFRGGEQPDGHGFARVDPAEEAASRGAAGYYSFAPAPGLRMIALDTVCEGGVTGPCADGNVDDPQFRWLEGELKEATAADQLIVLFGHHAIPSLTANVPDEAAPPCTAPDAHGHDVNPGCDLDPRASTPIHLGEDMVELLHRYPHVIAWVAGHSHVNDVTAYPAPGGGHGFWSIRTAAEADWPQQARLLEIFDNRDGTLSLFGTIVDHASPVTAPAPGAAASGMTPAELAALGRTFSYNDHQTGARACASTPCGEGAPEDRNVELLIGDPRRSASAPVPIRGRGKGGGRCGTRVVGTRKGEGLRGTQGSDLMLARGGRDRIRPRAGKDCVFAGNGNDRVFARRGGNDTVRCGRGRRDVAYVDRADRVRGCERVVRPKRR